MKIEREFAGAQLGDERLNKRLVQLAKSFATRHGGAISFSCGDWKSAKAAYRFFDNARFSEHHLIAPHLAATQKRMQHGGDKLLIIHDTTEFNYTHRQKTEGLGYLTGHELSQRTGLSYTKGFLMHVSMALTVEGVPLGLVYQKQWCRDLQQLRKVRAAGKNFTRVPIEEKESYKWLEGVTAACQQAPADTLIHICDRDADVYELFTHCLTQGTHFVVRAVHSRGTARKGVKSFARLSRIPVQGRYTLNLQSSPHRPARQAEIQVKYYRVRLVPPLAKTPEYPPVDVWVVSAKEKQSPHVAERDRIDWKLLTDLPVETFRDALEILGWYQARWNIEVYFKILKSGFGVEQNRLRHGSRLKKFAALVSVIAWRVFWVTKLARTVPQKAATLCFTHAEIRVLSRLEQQAGRPKLDISAPLRLVVAALARLGGYLARTADPPPGTMVVWRGLQRLTDIMTLQHLAVSCG